MSTSASSFDDRVETWDDLTRLVEHFSRFSAHDWLFRGVSDETHDLVTKVGRETARTEKRKSPSSKLRRIPYRLEDERIVFEAFRTQALSHVQRQPGSRLEWLALGNR